MCFFSYACQGADDQSLIRLNKVRVHGETEDPVCVMGDVVVSHVDLRFSPPGGGVWGQGAEPQSLRAAEPQ